MRSSRLLVALVGVGLLGLVPAFAADTAKPQQIDILIAQLGSSRFQDREKASQALDAMGEAALPALRNAARSGDAEVARRSEKLLRDINKRLETARLLAPKRVHLTYKET